MAVGANLNIHKLIKIPHILIKFPAKVSSLLSKSVSTSITLLADFPKINYVKCQPCVIFGPVRILERHSSCFFIILPGRDKGKSGYLRFIVKVPLMINRVLTKNTELGLDQILNTCCFYCFVAAEGAGIR